MDKEFALKLSAEIGIDVQQILREEVELVFLRGLFESSFSEKLIFKGGTALRLIFESPRFSEDLDFSLTDRIGLDEFTKVIGQITKSDERFSIRDLAAKYYTYLAEIKVKEPWQEIAFPVKIEVSKRVFSEKAESCAVNLAKSPSTNISVMVRSFTLEQMLKDKLRVIEERKMPRDIFDIWFICQKLNKPFPLKNLSYPRGKLRQELRKFLPKKYYLVIEELEKIND
jgi:predicted nucleotidyltransferase component of viral defense system